MGKRGPKPLPTATLARRGSWLAKKRSGDPSGAPDYPVCPDWLDEDCRRVWDVLVPELVGLGVMTRIDGQAFARYCVYSVLWLRELNNQGRTEATFERYANQLSRLEQSFGLTPSARSGLNVKSNETTKEESGYTIKLG